VLARLPDALPLLGGPLTLESLAFGGAIGLGLVAALLSVAPLSLILEPHDVVDAMPAALERTGIAVATSLNLVSGFGRTFTEVRDAQRMRGWKPGGLRSWNEILVPVVLTAIEDSVLLAESMEARAFGPDGERVTPPPASAQERSSSWWRPLRPRRCSSACESPACRWTGIRTRPLAAADPAAGGRRLPGPRAARVSAAGGS